MMLIKRIEERIRVSAKFIHIAVAMNESGEASVLTAMQIASPIYTDHKG